MKKIIVSVMCIFCFILVFGQEVEKLGIVSEIVCQTREGSGTGPYGISMDEVKNIIYFNRHIYPEVTSVDINTLKIITTEKIKSIENTWDLDAKKAFETR